jgi:hypothetical protein
MDEPARRGPQGVAVQVHGKEGDEFFLEGVLAFLASLQGDAEGGDAAT